MEKSILLPRENSVTAYGVSTHINIRLNIKANREIKSGAVFKKLLHFVL